MIIEEFKTIIIKASDGNYLTQKENVDIKERIIATTIALGKNDKADNYIEISAEKADQYKKEQEEANKNKE